MGAALGAGVGAVGGALVGDHLDKKREEQEKAEIYRQLELEKQCSSAQKKKYVKRDTKKRRHKIPPGHMPPAGKCRVWYSGRLLGINPQLAIVKYLKGMSHQVLGLSADNSNNPNYLTYYIMCKNLSKFLFINIQICYFCFPDENKRPNTYLLTDVSR